MSSLLTPVLRPTFVVIVSAVGVYAACGGSPAAAVQTLPESSKSKTVPPVSSGSGTPSKQYRIAQTAEAAAIAGCPSGMVAVEGFGSTYCIDRYEASLVDREGNRWPGNRTIDDRGSGLSAVSYKGRMPQGYISRDQADKACDNAGKRLCSSQEWLRACRGPEATLYPYGPQRQPNVCNDRYKILDRHPVARLFYQEAEPETDPKSMWSFAWMNDPRLHEMEHSVVPTGQFERCVSGYGVYDLVGNLHEWVADSDGTFRGGFFMDTYQNGEGCDYKTVAHASDYHDYSTGFRCCKSAS